VAVRQGFGDNMLDFQWDRFFWTAQARLPSWVGYQSRNGPYGSISSDEPSDGLVTIVVDPEGGKESPMTEQDRASVQWWLDHEAEVSSAVLEGLLAEYPRLQQLYGYEGAERETCMPDVSRTEEFRRLIGLHNVHFVPLLKEGLPYVGYEFGCTWDGEHGLGVLMHGSRVVEVGGADTAFTLWIAERDARGDATG
jgi:hypothetical protein